MEFKNGISYVNEGPFRPKFNLSGIHRLKDEGIISKSNLDDIGVLAWASSLPESKYRELFTDPFVDLNKNEKELSFVEKVAASASMLGLALNGRVIGKPSSDVSDYLVSELDYEMEYGTDVIIKDINKNPFSRKVRTYHRAINNPFFAVFDFRNESTQLFCNDIPHYSNLMDVENTFKDKDKVDFIAKFSILPAFPFYNVDKITMRKGPKGIEYSNAGAKEVRVSSEFFRI